MPEEEHEEKAPERLPSRQKEPDTLHKNQIKGRMEPQ
jgi:hypothetical protein